MVRPGDEAPGGIDIAALVKGRPLPPVERWHPPLCGEMDLRIARDGTWYHTGTPITRASLVRLFSTILRLEADGHHYLVSPMEKWRVRVEDAPFTAVLLEVSGSGSRQVLEFTTNVGDRVRAGDGHILAVEYRDPGGQPAPYLHVRAGLRALIVRTVFLELAALAEAGAVDGEPVHGVWSAGRFFALGPREV